MLAALTDFGYWEKFILASLATWRIAHLLAEEDGPADLLVRIRERLGESMAGRLLDCFYCLSLWIAAPMAVLVTTDPAALALTWPALSGAACLLHRLGRDTVAIEPIAELGDEDHGMLRPETSNTQEAAPEPPESGSEAEEAAHG